MRSIYLLLVAVLTVASQAFAQDAYWLTPRRETNANFTYTPSPQDWRDINLYQLFTDRFADGDASNNTTGALGIDRTAWAVGSQGFPQNRNFHHGGDWKGLKNNLDYLSGMGVRAVWISGVQMNDQGKDKNYTPYHMYHPTDFFRVDPAMGTFQDLKDLIDACHARGIYVVLDVVINHTADKAGLWGNNQLDDKQYWSGGNGNFGWWDANKKHAYPFDDLQWFHNNGTINNWDTYPEYIYGQFKGTDDLATEKDHVKYWITEAYKNLISATDCDGFRVDAIKHVDKDWCLKWADDMRQHAASLGKSDFILFGEYFTYDNGTLASYVSGAGAFNAALFFPMSQTIKSVFVDGAWTGQLSQALSAKSQYGEGENRLVTFIDNHDVNRIGLYISGGGDVGRINWVMKPALTFLYTGTPVPCLYYGTEQAFNQGGHYIGSNRTPENPDDGDWQRECMFDRGFQPGSAQGNKLAQTDSALYLHIKALNQARAAYPVLTRGSFAERWQNSSAGAYAFSRVYQDQEALVALNTADANQTINPQVAKPNGTEFVNALNPTEKVTVSGGRLAFTLTGRDSKIFVAGPVARPSVAALTSNATHIALTYTPNDGPLKTPTAPVQIGLKINGGVETFENMTAGANGTWTFSRPFEGISATLAITFRDSAATPVVDTTGGAAWTFDATKFGQPLVAWIGNTVTYPAEGQITAGSDLWVDIESYPQGAAAGGVIAFTDDDGTTWQEVALTKDGVIGGNDKLHANLGRFTPGKSIRFAVKVVDVNGVARWDNNGGSDYNRTIQYGTVKLTWIGDTSHWPLAGTIEAADDLWVNIASYPQGAGIGGEVIFSTDGGATWQGTPLDFVAAQGQNDLWHANLGTFAAGTPVRFSVKLTDTTNEDHWDDNGGANFTATVNGARSSLTGFDAVQANGRIEAVKPALGLQFKPDGSLAMSAAGRNAANVYTIKQSDDLVTWTTLRVIQAGDVADVWTLLESGDLAGKMKKFFRVEATGGLSQQVYADNPVNFSIRSRPPGGAVSADLLYSADGGVTWLPVPMSKTGSTSDGDTWSVDIPGRPPGSLFKYAIQLVDQQGNSLWANNGGGDYTANVFRPGQTDFTAPTVSHSPSNTTSSANSLAVTLSATDADDPSPVIYYTTDGSVPTMESLVYSGPITVTNVGSGVDMTIRYFAVDASSNRSDTKSVEVRVGQTQNFGSLTPYSTNPSLGQGVSNGGITIDGANTNGEWKDSNLIAIGMANDDPRSLGSNWTMHEAPINLTHIWAAWDDNSLYLAWQFVDVTDVIDPSNAGGAGSGRIGSNDGILQWIALDTNPNAGSSRDMWLKNKGNALWNGTNKPDVQLTLAGSLWQGYVSRAVNNVFPVDDGGVNYFSAAAASITYAKGATFAGSSLNGIGDADERRSAGAPNRNFLTQGHNTARDSFYEMKIPLAFLGFTRAQLESQGLGVMVGAGSASAMDVLPQDDGATLDTEGVEVYNSPLEWADVDSITVPFARVGAW
jgi:glycosidase